MPKVLYLTSDLLFSSRVAGLARERGVDLLVVHGRDQLADLLQSGPCDGVVVDLEHRDAQPSEIMGLTEASQSRPTVIAYGPHVKEPLLAAARDAGFDMVLSRGQFDQRIGQLLQSLNL